MPNCAQQEYCFVFLMSLQVLKTLPAFVIVLIVKICRVTSPKLVFLSMYDKLKLQNDATYEGIKWDFLRNFCSSLNNKLFFLRKHPPPKKNQHRTTSVNGQNATIRLPPPHDGFWLLLGQKSCYEKCDRTKMGARSPRPI